MHVIFVAGIALVAAAAPLAAQDCPPVAQPRFEFQVTEPAQFAGDSSLVPRPAADLAGSDRASELVVQFLVDTLGQPVLASFKALRAPSVAAADSVRTILPQWRFTPASVGGCKVPQLVQTEVER